MDDKLVGYLLKALDPEEEREVAAHLRDRPEARARLEVLRELLAPLSADAEPPEPPAGLVVATLARVAEQARPAARDGGPPIRRLPAAPRPSPSQWGAGRPRWFRRADVLVAAALLVLVGGLVPPWLLGRWHDYQVRSCQQNLSAYWQALMTYSDVHDGRFPQVKAQEGPLGYAGSFVPVLYDAGVLSPAVSVQCPAVGRRPPAYSLRDLETAYRERRGEFAALIRDAVPGYAYSLGYEEGERLHGLQRDLGDYQPLLADRPSDSGAGNSANHGGGGQNVLYIGGHARWTTDRNAGAGRDDIFLNRLNERQAGLGPTDTVLGPSDSTPYPR
jgi:hypothetical protein